ncbi:MAG: T9SS type A sorting domain-containing protein [Bacteroidetes bacterium]|nr:T9SS type A sorting domain-containing protein [Bacteroidota bacterium]
MRIIFLLSLLNTTYIASAQSGFEHSDTSNHIEYAVHTLSVNNTNHLFLINTLENGNEDSKVIMVDDSGNEKWSFVVGDNTNDAGRIIGRTSDGNIIIGGWRISGDYDFYLMKVDTLGNVLWDSTYVDNTYNDFLFDMLIDENDNIFVLSTRAPGNYAWQSFCLLKFDANGTKLWEKFHGTQSNGNYNRSFRFIQTYDNGFIMTGRSTEFGPGGLSVVIIKTDSLGDALWTNAFGTINNEVGKDIVQLADSGYMILADYETPTDSSLLALLRTDKDGSLMNTNFQPYPVGSKGLGIEVADDGNVVYTGFTSDSGKSQQIILTKADLNGDTLWTRSFGGSKGEIGWAIDKTPDGGFLLAGQSEGFGTTTALNSYFVRTDDQGNYPCPVNLSFNGPDKVCAGETAMYINTTVSSNSFNWYVDNNWLTATVNAAALIDSGGNYDITLAACGDSLTVNLVATQLQPDFTFMIDSNVVNYSMDSSLTPASFTWNFGDGNEDSIDLNPSHTYDSIQAYNVTLFIIDSNGCTGTSLKVVNLFPPSDTTDTTGNGVFDLNSDLESIKIYPNPAHGSVVIERSNSGKLIVQIIDVLGRQIILSSITKRKNTLDLSTLSPGLYVIRLSSKKESFNRQIKLIKQQ